MSKKYYNTKTKTFHNYDEFPAWNEKEEGVIYATKEDWEVQKDCRPLVSRNIGINPIYTPTNTRNRFLGQTD